MFSTITILQYAMQTEHPEEVVELIGLGFPHGADMENPIEDDAFMARIGAKRRTSGAFEKMENCAEYELTNAVTGTQFVFALFPMVSLFIHRKVIYFSKNGWFIPGQ